MAYEYLNITPDVALRDRGWVDNTIAGIQGRYTPNDVNGIAQELSNNVGNVSYQEIQSRLAAGAASGGGAAPNQVGYGGGGGGAAGPDPNEIAYYEDQISNLNRLLQSSNVQRDQGLTQIGDSYNKNVGRTNEAQTRTLSGYETKRNDNATARQQGLGQIDTNTRTSYDSLQRLLGLQGAGVSSAAQVLVPHAVSRYGTQQRTGALQTFGRNERDINTAVDDAKLQYKNALDDLLAQKQSKTEDFLRGILNQQSQLNQQLASAQTNLGIARGGNYQSTRAARQPYSDAVSSIQGQLDNLFNQYRSPEYNVQPVNPKAVELGKYTVDPLAIRAGQQNPGMDASVLPYLAMLKKEQQPNLLGGA